MRRGLAARPAIEKRSLLSVRKNPLDWMSLALFIAACTPVEIAGDRSAAGYAFLFRAVAALTVTGLMAARFGMSFKSSTMLVIVLIVGNHIAVNLLDPTASAFMGAATITAGLLLSAMVIGPNVIQQDVFSFLLRGYLIFHVLGFLLSALIWIRTGEAIDLHSLVFPFSSARQGEMLGRMRLTGFHIEPGTYANSIYIVTLIRAIFRRRLVNLLDIVALATAVATLAAWSVVGVGLYFSAMALEFFILDRRFSAAIRIFSTWAVVVVGVMALPAMLPSIMESDYADFMTQRLTTEAGSGQLKAESMSAWIQALDLRILVGQPLTSSYCYFCVSIQDIGTIINMIYYFGLVATGLIMSAWSFKLLRDCGLQFVVAALPLVFAKFYFHDFTVWIVLGLGLWSSSRPARPRMGLALSSEAHFAPKRPRLRRMAGCCPDAAITFSGICLTTGKQPRVATRQLASLSRSD